MGENGGRSPPEGREGVQALVEPGLPRVETDEFVEFWQSGAPATGEFHCAECAYGVTVNHVLPPRCPMCGGEAWEQTAWHPFTKARQPL